MSVEAMTWAWKQKTGNPASKVVLMALADQAGWDTWMCWPSKKLLAFRCEMSLSTVLRHLEALESGGFVQRISRRRRNGSQTSNCYIVLGGEGSVGGCQIDTGGVVTSDTP